MRHPAALRMSLLLVELEDQLVDSARDVVADCPDLVERQAGGVLEVGVRLDTRARRALWPRCHGVHPSRKGAALLASPGCRIEPSSEESAIKLVRRSGRL